MSIDLATISMEDIVGYDMEQTEQVVAAIGGRLLEISQLIPEAEAAYRALTSEGKWLSESKSALQSKLRSIRQALGG